MEDYREGERIREYKIEGLSKGEWVMLTKGISVGRKKIDYFDEIEVEQIRLIITQAVALPLIRSFSAYYVSDFTPPQKQSMRVWAKPETVASWKGKDISKNEIQLKVVLNDKINVPGQYILSVVPAIKGKVKILNAEMFYNNTKAMKEFVSVKGSNIHINQTAQITDSSNLYVKLSIQLEQPCDGKIEFKPELIHK